MASKRPAFDLGVESLKNKDFVSAVAEFTAAVELATTPAARAEALSYLGIAQLRGSAPVDALISYVKARRIFPDLSVPPGYGGENTQQILRCASFFADRIVGDASIRKTVGPDYGRTHWRCEPTLEPEKYPPPHRPLQEKTIPSIPKTGPPPREQAFPSALPPPAVAAESWSAWKVGVLSGAGALIVTGGIFAALAVSNRSQYNELPAGQRDGERKAIQTQARLSDILLTTGVITGVLGFLFID